MVCSSSRLSKRSRPRPSATHSYLENVRALGETASGTRRVVRTDRDEHAGRAAGGRRASGRDLHQERLSRYSLLQLYRSRDASCARDPAKSGNRCGRASILFVAFCPRVLNIRHAIPGYRSAGRECQKGHADARAPTLASAWPDCPYPFAHDARHLIVFCCIDIAWCCGPNTNTLAPNLRFNATPNPRP